jgi:hypothetical protein
MYAASTAAARRASLEAESGRPATAAGLVFTVVLSFTFSDIALSFSS